MAWIGVDFDGTMAKYDGWQGKDQMGAPIKPMVDRVKQWLAEGKEVRIVTARVGENLSSMERKAAKESIKAWCLEHVGQELPVTCKKDFAMIELWDDRCVQVIPNSGMPAAEVCPRAYAWVPDASDEGKTFFVYEKDVLWVIGWSFVEAVRSIGRYQP